MIRRKMFLVLGLVLTIFSLVACGPRKVVSSAASLDFLTPKQEPGSELVKIPVVVSPAAGLPLPKNRTVVITDISGECSKEVKDALIRRLVDNPNYNVVTRDHLDQIMVETENSWSGAFNSETATQLGDLFAASLYVVGRVVSCGESTFKSADGKESIQSQVVAVLQILDLKTGKILASSSTQGNYIPSETPLLVPAAAGFEVPGAKAVKAALSKKDKKDKKDKRNQGREDQREDPDPKDDEGNDKTAKSMKNTEDRARLNIPVEKAAEDLANGFADKFFSRPTWEDVEMWHNDNWGYSHAIRYVKLGHCGSAAAKLKEVGGQLPVMTDAAIAEYLHNYGVALLCDNQPELAMRKFRSAYRITYHEATLRMLGLAGRIIEWSLKVEVDEQPEIDLLLGRDPGTLLR